MAKTFSKLGGRQKFQKIQEVQWTPSRINIKKTNDKEKNILKAVRKKMTH